MTMPRMSSARARKQCTNPSEPNAAPTRRRDKKTVQFILAVVKDIWVREIQDTNNFYTDVNPKALLTHFQSGCTGRHALDLLALHNEMQRYHLEVEGIPKYTNMLDDAQKQAGRAAAQSPTKLCSSSQARKCSQLSDTQGSTMTGRIEPRKKYLGKLEEQLQEGAHQRSRKSTSL